MVRPAPDSLSQHATDFRNGESRKFVSERAVDPVSGECSGVRIFPDARRDSDPDTPAEAQPPNPKVSLYQQLHANHVIRRARTFQNSSSTVMSSSFGTLPGGPGPRADHSEAK